MAGTADELAYPMLLAAHGVLVVAPATARCAGTASSNAWGEAVWWGPPSATRPGCPSTSPPISTTLTGPVAKAISP